MFAGTRWKLSGSSAALSAILVSLLTADVQTQSPILGAQTTKSSSGTTCPLALLNCSVENLPSIELYWYIDNSRVAQYVLPHIDEPTGSIYPLPLATAPYLDNVVMVQILDASRSVSNPDEANFVSTMKANFSALRTTGRTNISCGSAGIRSNTFLLNFDITPPPIPFSAPCSLQPPPANSISSSLQWQPDNLNPVDDYQVQVSPEPTPTCSRLVRPRESYVCSGLRLMERYTFTVNATNCGDQESTATFHVEPNVPEAPTDLIVTPIYDQLLSLNEIVIQWHEVLPPTITERCTFNEELSYVAMLINTTGSVVERVSLNSADCCVDTVCSTHYCNKFFRVFPQDSDYSIAIASSNVFGQSALTSVSGIAFSRQSLFNLSMLFSNCMTTVECISLSESDVGECSIGYRLMSSNNYVVAMEAVNKSLNSEFNLPLLQSFTAYVIYANVTVNNISFVLRRNFTTGKIDPRLSAINTSLISGGVLAILMALIADSLLVVLFVKYKKKKGTTCQVEMPLSFFCVEVLLAFLIVGSILLWIAVGVQVGTQGDTCDLKWQSTRDGLIAAAFSLSLISLLGVSSAVVIYMKHPKKKVFAVEAPEEVDFREVKRCHVCYKIFILRSKFHCPGCGQVVCRRCLTETTYLPYLKKSGKVCVECIKTQSTQDKEPAKSVENIEMSASSSRNSKIAPNGVSEDKKIATDKKGKPTSVHTSASGARRPTTERTARDSTAPSSEDKKRSSAAAKSTSNKPAGGCEHKKRDSTAPSSGKTTVVNNKDPRRDSRSTTKDNRKVTNKKE